MWQSVALASVSGVRCLCDTNSTTWINNGDLFIRDLRAAGDMSRWAPHFEPHEPEGLRFCFGKHSRFFLGMTDEGEA
jgi:hypothetical protein